MLFVWVIDLKPWETLKIKYVDAFPTMGSYYVQLNI